MTIDYWLNRTPTQYVPTPARFMDLNISKSIDITVSKQVTVAVESDIQLVSDKAIVKTVNKTYNVEVC